MNIPYQPLYQANQLICGFGQIGIITGWTVKESLAKHLDAQEFAVIGNLYSPSRGISPLLRNLLVNPQVRFLVILKGTKEDQNAGGCDCLLDFFKQGVRVGKTDTDRDCWVINSQITGYIDQEIPVNVLDKLRQNIEVKAVNSISEAIKLTKSLLLKLPLDAWGEPLTFPEVKLTPTLLPGARYGHRIEGKTIAETWVKILHKIKTTGSIIPNQYGQWQELIDLTAIVTDEPPNFYFPNPNYLPIQPQFIQDYISQILDDAPQQEGVKYTYGQRLRSWFGRDQIQQVIDKLSQDQKSTRAVMSLWDVKDHEENESPPCLNHLWLRINHDKLSLTATFRSNDMFSAWVANAMGLRALQQHICEQINLNCDQQLTLAPLITISQSAHIYSDCWEYADQVIQNQYFKLCKQKNFDDPSGSFLIRVQDQAIVVEHLTPGSGEIVDCYSGKRAHHLYQKIAANCPSLEVEHALYLGTELQKAELALSHPDYFYQQDKPLALRSSQKSKACTERSRSVKSQK